LNSGYQSGNNEEYALLGRDTVKFDKVHRRSGAIRLLIAGSFTVYSSTLMMVTICSTELQNVTKHEIVLSILIV
jgi:hypothetical protein